MLLIPNTLPLLVQKLRLLLNSMTHIRFLTTRKMSFDIFGVERTSACADIDQILKPHVKPLPHAGGWFVLEGDSDSGHGSADNNNMVRHWKEKHGLGYFFNAPKSPDLACLESC